MRRLLKVLYRLYHQTYQTCGTESVPDVWLACSVVLADYAAF